MSSSPTSGFGLQPSFDLPSSSGRLGALSIPCCINFTTFLCNKLKVPERKGESKRISSHYLKLKNNILERIRKERESRKLSHARYSLHLSLESCKHGIIFPTSNRQREACLHSQCTWNTSSDTGGGRGNTTPC